MKHPGFKETSERIADKENISEARAEAILASSTRKASKKARKKNPRLNRVKGNPFYRALNK